MSDETVSPLEQFRAPWGREITLQHVEHESGLKLMRVRIREGRRFTIMDLDAATAARWGRLMTEWAEANPSTYIPAESSDSL